MQKGKKRKAPREKKGLFCGDDLYKVLTRWGGEKRTGSKKSSRWRLARMKVSAKIP